MGFLDSSGDILLDAVLTDAGRRRLAKGDGSFNISKWAVADDEINYELYNGNHASGSAYFDLSILQSPVLEALTDNGATMKHPLISIPRNDLLYLPILKLNENIANHARRTSNGSIGTFVVAVDQTTEGSFTSENGVMMGHVPDSGDVHPRIDQGLDTTEIAPSRPLDDNLVETQYIVEIDDRLGDIVNPQGDTDARPSFIDDDNIASYFFSLGTDVDFVEENTVRTDNATQTIAGPRGTILKFKVRASLELNQSDFLFDKLGDTGTITGNAGDNDGSSFNIKFIDTNVRVVGGTTGYQIDIPVRFIKDNS